MSACSSSASRANRQEVDVARWRERLFVAPAEHAAAGAAARRALGVLALIAAVFVWSLVGVPVLALAAAVAGAYAPVAWARRAGERARRERERAWPAALAQLADALEAGIAFPAAVALLGEAGPVPLRAEFTAFQARLRAAGLEAALDGLARAGERTSDTVALLLRAGLLELPAGRLAPLLRELSEVLAERFEAREKARTRASSSAGGGGGAGAEPDRAAAAARRRLARLPGRVPDGGGDDRRDASAAR